MNVMETYWAAILSAALKCLKWEDKDLAKFGGKSGHIFSSLIQSHALCWYIFKSVNMDSDYFLSPFCYHLHYCHP